MTLAAGPEGVWAAGTEVELPDHRAMALVEGGYAEPVRRRRETAVAPATATEAVGPGEAAVLLARDIEGIGEARAAALGRLGIVTAADLARADAKVIAEVIEGVGKAMAKRWIDSAREALR